MQNISIEKHPLTPFLPKNAKILMLGSFPPKQERWSMDFFYPNFINDMWRIMGVLYFHNKSYFEIKGEKRFDKEQIIEFCISKGIALFDTACEVRRLKDNASDKFLEVVTQTDIPTLLKQIPDCKAIVATGQKATETICAKFNLIAPSIGSCSNINIDGRDIQFWRMPSSSRAYPLSLEKKAEYYRVMMDSVL